MRHHHGCYRLMCGHGRFNRCARRHAAAFSSEVRAFGVRHHQTNGLRPRLRNKTDKHQAHGVRLMFGRGADAQTSESEGQWHQLAYLQDCCSDLKGPMTPRDGLGNRYLVDFVDHKSNYCRVSLARTKDMAVKQFEAFLVFFEKRFNRRIHVLRTDGGGEYANVDLFCKKTGVTRQASEARNQASNGKAERMRRTLADLMTKAHDAAKLATLRGLMCIG